MNHPNVPTIYGPLAQGLAGLLALSPFHASLFSIKSLVAGFDLLTIASLYSLGGAWPALAWAVHPLVVIEGAGEGHLDGVAVALLMASMALLDKARGRWASVLFAAAALVKLTPLGGAPAALRAFGRKGALLFLLVFAAAHLPFVRSRGPWRGLSTYAVSWEANGFVYPELFTLVKKSGIADSGKEAYAWIKARLGHPSVFDYGWGIFYPAFLTRAVLLFLFAAAVTFVVMRVSDPIRATGLCLVALLAASPTLHPWYLLEVLPFALLFEWVPVLWVAGAAPLVYLTFLPRGQPAFPHPVLVRAIEFVPALFFLLFFRTPRRSDA
ncbi:MAG TPA: hypothetical protein VGR00_11825 [Thermoanaerobaculia bacterium]|nr:hypothetical protein [Thermoanaerobaculia bacterium]